MWKDPARRVSRGNSAQSPAGMDSAGGVLNAAGSDYGAGSSSEAAWKALWI
jgi:hypothetical protein